ncbi:Nif3-like dinuclear metal center hexameric protein [Cohnella sp. REN36]|uniref:Nif3-like dinuclear metal center hexameric protein n=1 Tax=Cohnella sp. REN36 TaxID=2887347 RepID=UPI001D15C69F|nr:Nif3-like dinuclear metal center hexameric protein [Cohnella sp. REN36]MCC3376558.1 Nif3-like dinuclear metal center hexameric protein [Cohnella sp. REN36]
MILRICEVIERLWQPAAERPAETVDGLAAGEPDTEVRGIAVAFTASQCVLEQARERGANLLIVHEGVYYRHAGRAAREDDVSRIKREAIVASGVAVYRFHDGIHRYRPDGITLALAKALGWASRIVEHRPAAALLTLPMQSAAEVASHVKARLGLPFVRLAGDPATSCVRVGLLAGYRGGGELAIPLYEEGVDLLIAGEGPEWETPEYVRDAVAQGRPKALLLLGHAASEEPGMAALAEELRRVYPQVPVLFLSDPPIFQSL